MVDKSKWHENKKSPCEIADGNKICLGKNGGHKLSGLGGRSIVVVREADEILAVDDDNSFKIWPLQF